MSSVSGVNGLSNAWANASTQRTQMQAKLFTRVDADSSGGVDQTELQSLFNNIGTKTGTTLAADKLFSTMDSNSDGSLSGDELAVGMKDVAPPPPSTMDFAQTRNSRTDDMFSKVDANSDGSVDEAEMTAFTDKIKSVTGHDSLTSLAKLDSDSDGKLTKAEFDAGKPSAAGAGGVAGASDVAGADAPPPAGGPDVAPASAPASATDSSTYDALDTNKDGTVSELERLAGALKEFVSASESASESVSESVSKASSTASDAILKLAKLVYEQISSGVSSNSSGTLDVAA